MNSIEFYYLQFCLDRISTILKRKVDFQIIETICLNYKRKVDDLFSNTFKNLLGCLLKKES